MEDLLTDLEISFEYASVGKRFLAALIDYFIYMFALAILFYITGSTDKYIGEDTAGSLGALGVLVLWLLLYPGIETINNGKTLGKSICRIRVVNRQGAKVHFGNTLVRHLFDLIDYLPFLGIVGMVVASNNSNKQRVGDLVAKTMVIDAKRDRVF